MFPISISAVALFRQFARSHPSKAFYIAGLGDGLMIAGVIAALILAF